jgi:uncharacterized protein (UPF0276 family)
MVRNLGDCKRNDGDKYWKTFNENWMSAGGIARGHLSDVIFKRVRKHAKRAY